MDTLGQFLTSIRNAGNARHEKVDIPSSNIRVGLANVLVEAGYIRSFKVAKDSKQGIMRIYLKYDEGGKHVITSIDRVSKPGRRIYVRSDMVPKVRSGTGMAILSTSKGIMNGKAAESNDLGGELLCTVW